MKTFKKISAIVFILAGLILSTSKTSAQCTAVNAACVGGYDVLTSGSNKLAIMGGGPTCATTNNLNYLGINTTTPDWITDIVGYQTIDMVNISSPSGLNTVGFGIGGSMFLWHSGDVTSVYCGIGAGSSPTAASTTAQRNAVLGNLALSAGIGANAKDNTAVGYSALTSFTSTSGNCTAVGSQALYDDVGGIANVAVGYESLNLNISGDNNTAVGNLSLADNKSNECTAVGTDALETFNAADNTAVGFAALEGAGTASGTENSAVGSRALRMDGTGQDNVAVGYEALTANTTGVNNTGIGWEALNANIIGNSNTAVGNMALIKCITSDNTATGMSASELDSNGEFNVADGYKTLYNNKKGNDNVANGYQALMNDTESFNTGTGYEAGYHITFGQYNVAEGYEAMLGTSSGINGDSNTGIGAFTLQNITSGGGNAALGYKAGSSVTSDTDNVFVGFLANRGSVVVRNSAAIGYDAITTTRNQMELGNNNIDVTIGLSNETPPDKITALEISTQWGASPFNVNWGSTPPSWVNHGAGKGWSGLRFDDLKTGSGAVHNPGPGYLGLDTAGNVIYVDTAFTGGGSGTGFGLCSGTPPTLTGSAGINLNSNNVYFVGNGQGITGNNVVIGNGCTYTPLAKLDVYQHSKNTGSIGLLVTNSDSGVYCSLDTNLAPVIGIKSVVPNSYTIQTKIAGWFEAPGGNVCCAPMASNPAPQHAIFVPDSGGNVELGFSKYNRLCGEPYTLNVNGTAWFSSAAIVSDSTLKTGVTPITNALSKVAQLNGVSFQYIPRMVTDTGMSGTHYGFIAQQIGRVLPNAVHTSPVSGLKSLAYTEIIPWTVEAIKQLKQTNDSLRSQLDSLRDAFKSYATCLQTLCGQAPQQRSHSKVGDTGSSSSDNFMDVALSSSNSPVLYQNTPNPFSTGTKINYYLPEGTMGATMVFYDSYGNQMKVVELNQTGNGTLNVSPDNLTAGIYSYSLVVNNKVVDTKRMILQK